MQWFNNLPQFTRYWFGLSVVFPIAGRIGLVNPYHMILTSDFIYKFQVITTHAMVSTMTTN
jgi:derlin-1